MLLIISEPVKPPAPAAGNLFCFIEKKCYVKVLNQILKEINIVSSCESEKAYGKSVNRIKALATSTLITYLKEVVSQKKAKTETKIS